MKKIILFLCFLIFLQPPQQAAGPTPPPIPGWKDIPADEFIGAARIGNLAKMKQLYAQDPSIINKWDANKNSALIEAIKSDQRDIVTWLLEKKANIEHNDKTGKTAMDYAEGKPFILGALLAAQGIIPPPPAPVGTGAGAQRPASPKKQRPSSPKKETPKILAQPQPKKAAAESPDEKRRNQIIKEMRASGFWPEYGDEPYGVMLAAIKSKNLLYVQYAIETMKANPSSAGDDRQVRTPLYWATKTGDLDIINYLLKQPYVVQRIALTNRYDGLSPISYAALHGNKKIVKTFLEAYHNDREKIKEAIEFAQNGNPEAAQALERMVEEILSELPTSMQKGAGAPAPRPASPKKETPKTPAPHYPIPAVPALKKTAVAQEAELSDAEAKKIIAGKPKGSIWVEDKNYLLAQGIIKKQISWVKYAVEKLHADVNIVPRANITSPLYEAATSTPDIVSYLLSKNANYTFTVRPAYEGRNLTPLDQAARNGRADIVQIFLKYPISAEMIQDALKFAREEEKTDVIEILTKKLASIGAGVSEPEIAAIEPAPVPPAPQPAPKPSPLPKVEREQTAAIHPTPVPQLSAGAGAGTHKIITPPTKPLPIAQSAPKPQTKEDYSLWSKDRLYTKQDDLLSRLSWAGISSEERTKINAELDAIYTAIKGKR